MKLNGNFYSKSAEELAPLLLGKLLCRDTGGKTFKLRINETECYRGDDTACHAFRGKTARTSIMYEKGGYAYIYLCYGIHHLLNIVAGGEGFPEAVLIRGVEGFQGPGKLTKALKIDRELYGENLILSKKLWLEDDGFVAFDYKRSKRIGIDYAEEKDRERLWRFYTEIYC
ncbi:MAG: DNA-3-methyladenine glycosylase [Oscillospiraceae bacterium]|nr:DNA-3-methyladenine glycosylase [Oscillospiraceae bacterium]